MRRWIALLFASACAPAPAFIPAHSIVVTPASASAPAAAPVSLPHHVVDGSTGATLDEPALAARLRAARVIFFGEQHSDPHHHAAELELVERAFAADPSVGLGLEMLPRTQQAALDAYLAGGDERAFLTAVDWPRTWGFDFGFYRPLLEFCRAHRLRAFALNAPRSLAHAIAMRGLEALAPDERRLVPELRPGPAAHRELVREAFAAHPHGRFADAKFERFYQAQLVWDETMAAEVTAALAAPGAPRRLVVIAGEGHVRRFAVPARVERRGVAPSLTILPVAGDELEAARADRAADLYWVLDAK
jgi:uncharacterized iron-regulated protein